MLKNEVNLRVKRASQLLAQNRRFTLSNTLQNKNICCGPSH